MQNKKDKKKEDSKGLKPDPKTLHKTDPQDNMEGPVSSMVQNVKENVEEDEISKEEADKKKDENM